MRVERILGWLVTRAGNHFSMRPYSQRPLSFNEAQSLRGLWNRMSFDSELAAVTAQWQYILVCQGLYCKASNTHALYRLRLNTPGSLTSNWKQTSLWNHIWVIFKDSLNFCEEKNRPFFSSLSCRYSSRGVVNAMHSLGAILLHPKEVTTWQESKKSASLKGLCSRGSLVDPKSIAVVHAACS